MEPTLPHPVQLRIPTNPAPAELLTYAIRRRDRLARQAQEARWAADVLQHQMMQEHQRVQTLAAAC